MPAAGLLIYAFPLVSPLGLDLCIALALIMPVRAVNEPPWRVAMVNLVF